MNIKTRKLIRQLVLEHPHLSSDPQKLLDIHYNKTEEIIPEESETITKSLETKLDLDSLDWNSILELAKTNNITNYRKMKKSELVSILTELQNEHRLSQTN